MSSFVEYLNLTVENTTVPNSNISDIPLPGLRHISSHNFYIFLAFSILLAVVILVGNTLVIVAYKYNVRLQTGTNRFLASLAASDLIVGAVSIPLWIYTSRLAHTKIVYTVFICVDIVSALASILHLTGICVERYVALSKPICHRTVNPRVFNIVIFAAWVVAVAIAAMYPVQREYNFKKPYVLAVFILGFAAPLVTISLIHVAIFRISRRVLRSQSGQAKSRTLRRDRYIKKERRTAITVSVITSLFFVAWSPYFVILFLSVYFPTSLPTYPAIMRLAIFAKWMHHGNSAVNPFVYAFRNTEMRKTFVRLFAMVCYCRSAHQGRTEFYRSERNTYQMESRVLRKSSSVDSAPECV